MIISNAMQILYTHTQICIYYHTYKLHNFYLNHYFPTPIVYELFRRIYFGHILYIHIIVEMRIVNQNDVVMCNVTRCNAR